MEPVRPITNGPSALVMEKAFQTRPCGGRYASCRAKKGLERGFGLIHEHAETVDYDMSTRLCPAQQIGDKGIVDEIADRRSSRKIVERKIKALAPFHAG